MRLTFASRLAMVGVGIRAIQDVLGHKSIAMTVRYSHLSPDFLLNVVERLVPKPTEGPQRNEPSPLPTPERFNPKPHSGPCPVSLFHVIC